MNTFALYVYGPRNIIARELIQEPRGCTHVGNRDPPPGWSAPSRECRPGSCSPRCRSCFRPPGGPTATNLSPANLLRGPIPGCTGSCCTRHGCPAETQVQTALRCRFCGILAFHNFIQNIFIQCYANGMKINLS